MFRSKGPFVDYDRRSLRGGWRQGAMARFFRAPPRGTGLALTVALFAATGQYGVTIGAPVNPDLAALGTPGDMIANALGFRVQTVTIKGQQALTDSEILAAAGVTDSSSTIFLDAGAARDGLQALPLVASATVHKLFPSTLAVTIVERIPFALWQKEGRIHIIAEDGTVIDEARDTRFAGLPFVVGEGAGPRAAAFFAELDKVPDVKSRVRAAVLVAQRRWNLVLDNNVIVRLPEEDIVPALNELADLQAEGKVFDKAVLAIDLRLSDRVAFRLTAEAAAARAEWLAAEEKKRKKGAAT